ncbi:MAG: HD domain-containing protein [Candidatus Magasanikbacteria bacterium]|nr:HD domain-containing protein [Candidatus Magasanikbacteria bacterium]
MSSQVTLFKKIHKLSEQEKTPVYVVGGYVRDFLLGHEDKDIDCVVVGSGLAFAKMLDAELTEEGSLVEFPDFDTARYIIGPDFAVAQNRGSSISSKGNRESDQIVLEFAGARSESYRENSRKPKVEAATLEQDLSRRDFTINSMAVPIEYFIKKSRQHPPRAPLRGGIIDPFNGQQDLKDKILKTPLDPDVTFSDDPLRMLRAIRFASQLGFAIEKKTLEAIHRNRERLKIISAERVQEELMKLLATKMPSVGLTLLFQTHLLDIILPEVSKLDGVEEIFGHQHKNNLVHSFKVVDNIAEQSNNVWLRFAGLLHDIGKPGTKKFLPKIGWTFHAHEHLGKKLVYGVAKRLKLSKDHTDYIAKLVRWHMQPIGLMDEGITDSAVRRLVVTLGEELDDLLILGRSDITTGNPYKKEKRLKNYDHLKAKIAEVLERDKLRAFQSPFRGDEIMAMCQLKPGPTVGKIKDAIEEAILDGKIPNQYEAAKEYFIGIKDEYLKNVQDWEKLSLL